MGARRLHPAERVAEYTALGWWGHDTLDARARYFPRYGVPGAEWSTRGSKWTSMRLVDLVTGEDITEPGRPGELRLSSPQVFAGYLGGHRAREPVRRTGAFEDRRHLRDRRGPGTVPPLRLELRESLPRNPVGKVLKRELRREAENQ